MTDRPSITVLADDFTGAAEIAAMGYRCGLASVVVAGGQSRTAAARLVVFDTDTRLRPPAEAAGILARATAALPAEAVRGPLFKKTDSMLRGNVVAEVEAMAAAAGRSRVLLVPANPSLGRTICDGVYFVGGTPIHQTPFAHDPHHPATSSSVTVLLGTTGRWPVRVITLDATLPDSGIVVGEVTSPADVARWAGRIDGSTLPAGGGEFFSAFLRSLGHAAGPPSPAGAIQGPLLLVSGTTAPAGRAMIGQLAAAGLPVISLPAAAVDSARTSNTARPAFVGEICQALATRRVAILHAPFRILPGAGEAIRTVLASITAELHRRAAFAHLVVEGGATAAAILQALKWSELAVVAELAQGVVTVCPVSAPAGRLTIKPGSYPWPDGWAKRLAKIAEPTVQP